MLLKISLTKSLAKKVHGKCRVFAMAAIKVHGKCRVNPNEHFLNTKAVSKTSPMAQPPSE